MTLTIKSPKCTPLGMKRSKSRRFLGLRPRPRWGSLQRSPNPYNREGLLAFGNRSFRACNYPNAHVLVGIPASKPPFHLIAPQPSSSGYATGSTNTTHPSIHNPSSHTMTQPPHALQLHNMPA